MKLIVKKCLSVLFLLLLVSPLVYGQQSCLSDIGNDFQDLKTSLKNPKFLDPAPSLNYDDREGKKVLMVVVHHTESPTLRSTKYALNSSERSVQLIVDRDGTITLMVPLEKLAWNAGIIPIPAIERTDRE